MIKIYRKHSSDRRLLSAIKWLEVHNLAFKIITPKNLTKEDIEDLLKLSENGFEDIMIDPLNPKISDFSKWFYTSLDIDNTSTKELISTLIDFPNLLREPIIFDESRLLIGFNNDEIRMFVPRSERKKYKKSTWKMTKH